LLIGEREFRLSFRGDKGQRIEKGVLDGGGAPAVVVIPRGPGSILWSPLPVELAEQGDASVALYDDALKRAGVAPVVRSEARDPSVLVFSTVFHDTILVTLVSEAGRDRSVRLVHAATGSVVPVTVPAQRAAMLLIVKSTGKVVSTLQ
jgi:hypothetical protein